MTVPITYLGYEPDIGATETIAEIPSRGPYGTPRLDWFDGYGEMAEGWEGEWIVGEPEFHITDGLATADVWASAYRVAECPVAASEVWGQVGPKFNEFAWQRWLLRGVAPGGGAYGVYLPDEGAPAEIGIYAGGMWTPLKVTTQVFNDYDWVALVAIDDTLSLYRWVSGETTWTLIDSVADATYAAAGYIGIEGNGDATFADFGGGGLSPIVREQPVLTGSAEIGETLAVSTGRWYCQAPSSFSYQWQRDSVGAGDFVDIDGATSSSYVIRASSVRARLRCMVTATNAYGSSGAASEPTGVVAALDNEIALASYRCYVAWDTYQLGLLTFDYSLFGGSDVFAPHPFAAAFSGDYDDLSAMLHEAEVEIGRDSYLEMFLASRARVRLRDPTGILNAENVSSPLYSGGELTDCLHPIQLLSVYGGETSPVFSGWVRDISWSPAGRKGYADLDCVDLFYWLNRAYPVIEATGPTTTGAVIGLILDAIGWTDTTLRDLDIGDAIPNFSADGSRSGLALIEGLLAAERGTFFIAADGTAVYRDRSWRQKTNSIALIEDEMTFASPGIDYDASITRARVTRTQTGYTAEATAAENDQRRLGWNDLPEISTPYLIADAAADSLADWFVWILGQPRPLMHELNLDNRSAYSMYQMLALGMGDRITLAAAKTGLSEDFHVERIQHHIGGRPRHTCSYLVSRVIPRALRFGLSEFVAADATEGDVFVY